MKKIHSQWAWRGFCLKDSCPPKSAGQKEAKFMSSMVKSRFAGLLRGILRRMDTSEATAAPVSRPVAASAPAVSAISAAVATAPALAVPHNPPPAANEVALPLAPIVTGLSMELRGKIMIVPPPGMTINLPIDTITSQLAFGAVKISFGELRQLAANIFANSGGEHDHKLVNLPLNEILPRLNPALLARRTGPKVEVAEDINGPFGGRGQGVAFTTQPLKSATPPVPRTERPEISAEAPAPVAPIAFTPPPSLQRPVAPLPPAQPVRPMSPVVPPPAAPKPVISAAPVPAPAPAAPRPEPAQPTIFAALWDLAEIWPEELKEEISRTALANVSVPLTGNLVAAGLKRGRITMSWKQLRTLAKPSSPASPNDNVELDLPLKVIAPLFFAAQKNQGMARKAVKVSEEIPNLFFGFPQAAPAAPEAPVAAPKPVEKKTSDSNFYVWGDAGEAPKTDTNVFAPPPVPQTDFTHRQAPPKDVVARALQLPGVVGAVVTLPDGLRVASETPAEFNADTLAAFIPQIFERMNQSAKELRMGILNNVSFTVGNVPWRIFRVNSVYFAAFGRAGEALPAAQLVSLAGELDRKRNQ